MRPVSAAHTDDRPVITTNDAAFETKISAMDRGYFVDAFLAAMKDAHQLYASHASPYRAQPVMNRGTYARVLIKSTLLSSFLARLDSSHAQVVSLGAGFDSFPFNLLAARGAAETQTGTQTEHPPPPPPRLRRYLEVDLLPVVRDKVSLANAFLKPGDLFSSVRHDNDSVHAATHARTPEQGAAHYSLCPCDLRDVSSLRRCLEEAGLDRGAPTVILAEIVLVYLDPARSDAVIQFVNEWFSGTRLFVNIEHTGSGDAFGHQMDSNIASRGSPLLGMRKYPTMAAQRERFARLGWRRVSTRSMLECFNQLKSREDAVLLQRIEFLDEVEEWNMLMEHYCVVLSLSGESAEAYLDWIDKPFVMPCKPLR